MSRAPPYLLLVSGLLWLSLGLAAQPSQVSDLDLSVQASDIEPTVTLREHENRAVEEYRVNNNLYMVKITPTAGAPYYLVDDDGTGDMQWRRDPGDRTIRVPQWTLFRW